MASLDSGFGATDFHTPAAFTAGARPVANASSDTSGRPRCFKNSPIWFSSELLRCER